MTVVNGMTSQAIPPFLRRRKPWWVANLPKKNEPTPDRPSFFHWTDQPPLTHAWRRHPAFACIARCSMTRGFFPIPGITQPPLASKYYTSANYRWDANGQIEYLTPGETRDEKIQVHAAYFARQIADSLFADGLLRGKGSHHDGEYGGGFSLGEVGIPAFTDAEAYRRFVPLMQDMRDATPRTVSVATEPGGLPRDITLPKRGRDTLPLIGTTVALGTTAEDLAAIEAQTDGVRHTGVWSMRSDFGRAECYEFVYRTMALLKTECDEYVAADGYVYQLAYPKFCPLSLENYGYNVCGALNRSIPADVTGPLTQSAFVEQIGIIWSERGNPDSYSPRFDKTPIYKRRSDGKAMTLRDAIAADPELSAPVGGEYNFLTEYAPALTASKPMTLRQTYAFRRIEWAAVNWAIHDAIARAIHAFFPLCEVSNFDHVVVKDINNRYRRGAAPGAIESSQTQNWLGRQAPTLYPWATGPGRNAIRDAANNAEREKAVRQFDFDNLEVQMNICSTIDFSGVSSGGGGGGANGAGPALPFIFGIELEAAIVSGAKTEWGGTREALKQLLMDQRSKYGFDCYAVYSGNLDATTDALSEISAEMGK